MRALGRYVATSSCAGQSLRSDLDLSLMFRKRVFSASFFVKINLFRRFIFCKNVHVNFCGYLNIKFVVSVFDPNS